MTTVPINRPPLAWALGLQLMLATLALYGAVSLPGLEAHWMFSATGIALFLLWLAVAAATARMLWRAVPSHEQLAMLALGIIALRLCFGALVLGRLSTGDADIYPVIARQLLAGQGLNFDQADMGERVFALYPPFYPVLLAAWGAVTGFSTWSLIAMNMLVDCSAAWLIMQIGTALKAPAAGRSAAFLYLIWPSVLFSAPLAQKEGVAIALILLLALVWIRQSQQAAGGWRGALALGVPAGLLAMTQPGQAPLAALFGLMLVGRIGVRRLISFGLAGAGVAVIVMLPWWVRNWLVFGAFVPLTSAGGISFWIGNNPDATGNWMPQPEAWRGLPEIDYARRASGEAMAWIKGHPADFVRLTIAKFLRAAGVSQFGLFRISIMAPAISPALAAMLFPLSFGAHWLMLGAGAVSLRLRQVPGIWVMTLLLIAGFVQLALFGVWFEFGERHREFLTPFLLLLGCMAAEAVQGRNGVGARVGG
ncbi:MAG: glycosyltransferase [Sphingomonas sp.]|nr:glycosyltransferase [Sphingomonas sp.]